MLEKGLPVGAVKNALQRDGLDPGILDLDPSKSLSSQTKTAQTSAAGDSGVPLREDPEWKKYFTMLKMGLSLDQVKNAATRDGKDATVLDLDPNKSVTYQR